MVFLLNSRFFRKRRLTELDKSEYNLARNFSKVIKDHALRVLSDDEKIEIKKIDLMRKSLLNNTDKIVFNQIGGLKDNEISFSNKSITLGEICKNAASPRQWGEFQFRIVRAFKPINCLELGTNLGISGHYILSALRINNKGRLITLEGNSELAKIASENFEKQGFENFDIVIGLFQETLDKTLEKCGVIDYGFY